MDKVFEIQKQVRENAKTLNSYITDLQNWESEMKRKETALSGGYEQDLPPVRSKVKKEKPVIVKKPSEKRIPSSDYKAWESFDVDKACEDIDMEDKGPTSLDSKKSNQSKMEKLREEAQYEKERGNKFVKQEKWDEAIACYNRAIELVKDDAIYYANRGLCYLKKDRLQLAERDCTEALRLEPTYVKALARRGAARERLGALRAAAADLAHVLRLEPHNRAARDQLDTITARMGTKGSKCKSSPLSTPTTECKPSVGECDSAPRVVELDEPDVRDPPAPAHTPEHNWRHGVGENVTILKTVKKPPHLRSKRPLKPVPIHEIQLGKKSPEKVATRLTIEEVEVERDHTNKHGAPDGSGDITTRNNVSPESVKLITESTSSEKQSRVLNLVPPASSVQFMSQWKCLRGDELARTQYFSIIEPSKIPSIFANSLESEVLSDLVRLMSRSPGSFHGPGRERTVAGYLRAVAGCKRFGALAMFLSHQDKQAVSELLQYCETHEGCSAADLADLRHKYEL